MTETKTKADLCMEYIAAADAAVPENMTYTDGTIDTRTIAEVTDELETLVFQFCDELTDCGGMEAGKIAFKANMALRRVLEDANWRTKR